MSALTVISDEDIAVKCHFMAVFAFDKRYYVGHIFGKGDRGGMS
jgi:hypothetical protein